MLGLMQDRPLLISQIITHAARHHARAEVVSRTVEGDTHRYTYADLERRARRLARALQWLDVRTDDRVATLAWNGYRHLELYYGVSGMQAICHTVNPRLSPDDVAFILQDAGSVTVVVNTGAIVLHFYDDLLALAGGPQTDRRNLALTSGAANLGGLDAVIDGISQYVQQRFR